MTDYTPTTQEVRDEWRWNGEDYGPAADAARTAEFDRWLAGVIRQAKHDGWEEGADASAYYAQGLLDTEPVNPYADE